MELIDIKTDNRGTIFKFKIGQNKFLIVITKGGAMRAGEIHNVNQYTFLLAGAVEVITKQENKDVHELYFSQFKENKKIEIPKGTPHYFKFLEGSLMIENDDENMTTEYYPEYRKLVEKSMNDIH